MPELQALSCSGCYSPEDIAASLSLDDTERLRRYQQRPDYP